MKDQRQVEWYRTPVDRSALRELTQRSNTRGFLMAGVFIGLLVLLGVAFVLATQQALVLASVVLFFCYATVHAFLINGFHELVHGTVFRSKWLNQTFLVLFSFLFWGNPHYFRESHMRHHLYTLHPPDDLEVRLPVVFSPKDVIRTGIIDVGLLWRIPFWTFRTALGRLDYSDTEWNEICFPQESVEKRRELFRFARFLIVGHIGLTVGFVVAGWWQIPLLVSLAYPFGRWLHILCNTTQHAGLQEDTTDFRLSARSFLLSPLVEFLYWHMNYHIEHHMYASVPCYNLRKLNRLLRHDLPEPPRGLWRTWKHIFAVLRRQSREPDYVFVPEIPGQL